MTYKLYSMKESSCKDEYVVDEELPGEWYDLDCEDDNNIINWLYDEGYLNDKEWGHVEVVRVDDGDIKIQWGEPIYIFRPLTP
jgi:hypothetical protein